MTTSREIAALNVQICETFGVDPADVVSLDLSISPQRLPSLIITRHQNAAGGLVRTVDRYYITEKVTP